jgi:UPF0716 family protein affecting phage T7 exclusion
MRRSLIIAAVALVLALASAALVAADWLSWQVPVAVAIAAFVVGGFVTRRKGRE